MDEIKAIIVDDEPEARDILDSLLSDFSEIEILTKENSADTALVSILKLQPDLVFLDIDMPHKTGFDLVKELKQYSCSPTIIFVTAYNHYAIDAIKHAAFDYLVKPVDIDDLQLCISRFKTERNGKQFSDKIDDLLVCIKKDKIRFKTREGFIFIDTVKIIYCKADGNYTNIYLTEMEQKQTVSMNLGSVDQLLPNNFSRISRSVIINRNYLKEVNRINRKCKLSTSSLEIEFDIPRHYIKQLETL